jgi:large conductance mechanosensitive channel
MVIRGMNKMKKQEEEKPAEPAKPSEEVQLLTDIRDALKNRG